MSIAVNRVYEVTTKTDPLRIRKGPGTSYTILGSKKPGATFTCKELSDDSNWAKDSGSGGWLCIDAGEGYAYLTIVSTAEGDPQYSAKDTTNQNTPIQASNDDINYDPYLSSYEEYDASKSSKIPIKTIKGILGMPYQFMKQTDSRLLDDGGEITQFGRKYSDRILTNLPLLFLTPGKPSFLQGFKKSTKDNILTSLAEKVFNVGTNALEDLLNGENGRYYTFNMDYANYYKYLNPMCRIAARYLGIQDKLLFGTPLDQFDWATYTDPIFKTYISASESIGFYIDSPTQISESFSNSTTSSMLEGTIAQGSDLGREIGFLLGAGAGLQIDALKEENFETTKLALDKINDKWFNGSNIISRFTSGLQTVAMGGQILFPEIWSDSEFSRSYDVDIKLRTPYGDKLSWYLNILVPTLHILTLTAPKQLDANGYYSPFLVRAFYKGLFNVDMGIITSMSINKGNQGSWTVDGLPTEVDISISIKDLYSALSISSQDKITSFVNNTYLMDYLANTCGININKPELLRSLDMYMNQIGLKFTEWPSRVWRDFQNSLSNGSLNIYDKIKF